MINTKVASNQSNDSEKDDNISHFDNNVNNNNNKLLHNYVFIIILVLSVFIIFIPLSLICGYLMGKKDYLKQYNLYNKVKDMLDLLYSHPPLPPPGPPHHNQHHLYPPYPIYYHEASQCSCDEHHQQSHHCHHRHSNNSNNQECYQNHGSCLTTSDVNMIYLCEQSSTNIKNENANDSVNDQARQSYATTQRYFYDYHPSEMLNKTAMQQTSLSSAAAALKAANLKNIPIIFDPIRNIHVISDCIHSRVDINKEYVQRNHTFSTLPTKISSSGTTSYTFSSCYTNTATSSYHHITPFDYFTSPSSTTTTLPSTSFKHIQPSVILTETNNNNNTLLSDNCHQNCYNTNNAAKRTVITKPLKTSRLFGHSSLKKPRTSRQHQSGIL
ncbi:unnamed protein product [Trichobilharzia regenti]|nr:unnamed protein product [Trichobilharzia regenti]